MAKNNKSTQLVRGGFYNKIKPKAISRTRSDINTWKSALRAADSVDNPKRTKPISVQITEGLWLQKKRELSLQTKAKTRWQNTLKREI